MRFNSKYLNTYFFKAVSKKRFCSLLNSKFEFQIVPNSFLEYSEYDFLETLPLLQRLSFITFLVLTKLRKANETTEKIWLRLSCGKAKQLILADLQFFSLSSSHYSCYFEKYCNFTETSKYN